MIDLEFAKQQIASLKKEIESLAPINSEQEELLDKKFRLEFHYNTNHIEGNTLTYAETELLFLHDEARGSHKVQELEEMKASDIGLKMIKKLANDNEASLNEKFIKELNGILLVRPFYKEALTSTGQKTTRLIDVGDYKKFPNNVRLQNGEIFEYTSPGDTIIEMGELVQWLNNELDTLTLHPVELAAELHYKFVRIHPFDDGNGRISRLLMNYILYRFNYPPVIIKSDDKKNYLSALHDADVGNLTSFKSYVAKQLIWSLELQLKAAKGEKLEEDGDWQKELTLLKRDLDQREGINVLKSEDVVTKVILERILPFTQSIEANLQSFNELFLNCKSWFVSPSTTRYVDIQGINIDIIEELFTDDITFASYFVKFKKNEENAFNIITNVKWEFNEYKYTVTILVSEPIIYQKFYHQDLSEKEKKEIISALGKDILLQIKKNMR